jgi:hypothetical protein
MIRVLISRLNKVLLKRSPVEWRDFRSVEPISRQFGLDRGSPIDRYYMRKFLEENKSLIHGKLIEIGDNNFSRMYGSKVSSYDILHVEKSKKVTIVGDLTNTDTLPENLSDCFICTQVFNFIYDFHAAIRGAHFLLKPGGAILATVGGISQVSRYDADRWGHYWGFYPQGIEKAFKAVFGDANVEVKVFGNSLVAAAFVKGVAFEELTIEELDFVDQDYPVSICIKAFKRT